MIIKEIWGETYTYKSFARFNQRPIHAIHLMIQSARITQIMAGAVATPQRRWNRPTINTFASLAKCKIHGTVIRRGALKTARIVRPPRSHHHILCVKLCGQLGMRGTEIIGCPAILCNRTGKRCPMAVLAVWQWTTGWHIDRRIGGRYRCLVMIGTSIANTCCHFGVGWRWMKHCSALGILFFFSLLLVFFSVWIRFRLLASRLKMTRKRLNVNERVILIMLWLKSAGLLK